MIADCPFSVLGDQCRQNKLSTDEMSKDVSVPLNYYAVFVTLQNVIPKNAFIVSEGANTMDIGRTILANHLPRFGQALPALGDLTDHLSSIFDGTLEPTICW